MNRRQREAMRRVVERVRVEQISVAGSVAAGTAPGPRAENGGAGETDPTTETAALRRWL